MKTEERNERNILLRNANVRKKNHVCPSYMRDKIYIYIYIHTPNGFT